MANMKHCRFENTFEDLNDCRDALEEMICIMRDVDLSELSEPERKFAERLILLCDEISAQYGDIATSLHPDEIPSLDEMRQLLNQ